MTTSLELAQRRLAVARRRVAEAEKVYTLAKGQEQDLIREAKHYSKAVKEGDKAAAKHYLGNYDRMLNTARARLKSVLDEAEALRDGINEAEEVVSNAPPLSKSAYSAKQQVKTDWSDLR